MKSYPGKQSFRSGSNAPRTSSLQYAARRGDGWTGGVHRSSTPLDLASSQSLNSTRNVQTSAAAASYRGPESFPAPKPKITTTSSPSSSNSGDMSIGKEPSEAATEEVMLLVRLLPPDVRARVESDPRLASLVEVVMDLGRPPLARFPIGDVKLSDAPVTDADLRFAVEACGDFGGDNRAGIDSTLHRISAIRNRAGKVVGLTCRVGRAIQGSAAMVADLATAGRSILLLGRPGVGKTTAIREISRLLADDCLKRVVIVDTSNEIGGDGDVPHPGVGGARRMQVSQPEQQHRVMIEAVENHMPEVIVIDEIGTEAEALAARTIAQRGVQLVATAHGNELENVMKNPTLNDLVGGVASVTLGDDEAKRRGVQKSILERSSPPTFDVAIEMVSRERWKVHLDVAYAVDQLLLGYEAGAEVREKDSEGKVWAWPEDAATSSTDDDLEGPIDAEEEARRMKKRRGKRVDIETQPFPEAALAAARGTQLYATGPSNNVVTEEMENLKNALKGSKSASKPSSHPASARALKVYPYGVDADSVLSVAEALNLRNSVAIASQIQEADAVLATRSKLKASGWVKIAAQQAGLPVFTVKTAAVEHVVKGVRTLLGVDPAPGGIFSSSGGEGPPMADPRVASSRNLRAETSIALVKATPPSLATIKSGLDEAREAIESIVLKQNQPVELLPRHESIVERQVALARGYGLSCEVAGTAAAGGRRVRVLPMNWVASRPEDKEPVAVKKEFW